LTAGDSGIQLIAYPTYKNVSGQVVPYFINQAATVDLLVQLIANPEPTHESFLMVIAADGYSATYTTTGVEFPLPGLYNITMRIFLGGYRLTADHPIRFRVDPDFVP
jgi:hypothetical protein